MKPIEAVLIGAGGRGIGGVGRFAERFPEELNFVAVAEPIKERRDYFARVHNIPEENCFESWEDVVEREQMAPLCFNMTMDRTHYESAMKLLDKGYHLFLEKPMADTPVRCLEIAEKARQMNRMLQICHPMRFTPIYTKIKELLDQGEIGDIISLSMYENVAYWHFAHSYVRGNWHRYDESGPLILTKCCHDMDLATWLVDTHVRKASSFGNLKYFRRENAPAGAPENCMKGCPEEKTCPYFAPSVYLTEETGWPVSAISVDTSYEARKKALEEGPYGKCVFRNDNDIVDHQVVAAEFENGVTLDFAVRANTFSCYRTARIIGTKGELNAHDEKSEISIRHFVQGNRDNEKEKVYKVDVSDMEGHQGGDEGVIRNFLRCYRNNEVDYMDHSLDIAVEGHLLSFGAEEARTSGKVLDMKEFKKRRL